MQSLRQRFFSYLISPPILFVIFLYLSLVIFFMCRGLTQQSLGMVFLLFFLGILIWTFVEYLIHRFIFHGEKSLKLLRQLQFFMHGYHHECPTDRTRLLLPLVVTLPAVGVSYILYKLLMGECAESMLAGFILGYLIYDLTHYAVHCFNPKMELGKFYKRYHFHHHFKTQNKLFGVTSPIWDYVFGTLISHS